MGIPDSLSAWRRYADAETPAAPAALNAAERLSLTCDARESYDDMRIRWLSGDYVLATPDVHALRRVSAVLRAEALATRSTSPRTLAISGPAASGKTTAAMWIARDHDRKVRASRGPDLSERIQPAIYVVVPPATSPKMLLIAFCNYLGIPYSRRQSAQELMTAVIHVLRGLQTSLVVVDEIHNVQSNRQIGAEAASTLKQLAERVDAGFVLLGIDLDRSPVFAGDIGAQFASRATRYDMHGHSLSTKQSRAEWLSLVQTIALLTPLAESPHDVLSRESKLLFHLTGGSIGALRSLIRKAAIDAILSGTERITLSAIQLFSGTQRGLRLPHTESSSTTDQLDAG